MPTLILHGDDDQIVPIRFPVEKQGGQIVARLNCITLAEARSLGLAVAATCPLVSVFTATRADDAEMR